MAEAKPQSRTPIVRIVGRIEDVRRTNSNGSPVFVHLVKLPAEDEFSSPATVRISSADRCGEVGAAFDQLCRVGGYARTYQTQDDETGRKATVKTADNSLTVVG